MAAITEQLIELERAMAIQRRLIARVRLPLPRDRAARRADARRDRRRRRRRGWTSFDLAPKRAIAMRRCAEGGRARPRRPARARLPAPAARSARSGRGRSRCSRCTATAGWTSCPAGDLGFLKLVGRLTTGNPRARADEAEVRGFFEPYGEWKGLAGAHLMRAAATGLIPARMSPGPAPRPAGTRWSAARRRPAAA